MDLQDGAVVQELRDRVEAARLVPLPPGSGRNGSGLLDLPLALLARNDIGNAERFRKRFGADYRFLQEGNWMVWDGRRWDRDAGPIEAAKAAQSVAIAIREEANALDNVGPEFEAREREPGESDERYIKRLAKEHEDRVDGLRRHATNSGNTSKLAGMLKEAAPHLWAMRQTIDADPWRLNFPNCTLDLVPPDVGRLEDGEWPWSTRPHRREDLITRIANGSYVQELLGGAAFDRDAALSRIEAAAPKFWKFLHRVQPDSDMRDYLARLAGYMLTGDTGEQELSLHVGRGANGKGTFFEALAHAMGGYAATLPIDAIKHQENRNGSQARPEIARLPGARFVRISEADENERLSEGVVKKITGQDVIEVRELFKGMFEFVPQFKLVIYVNDKPAIRGTDDGIWRRIRLVEWPVQIPKAQRDRGLPEALKGEADAILAWALVGYADWRVQGLAAPKQVEDASEAYRIERDPLVRFVDDCLVPDFKPNSALSPGDLYDTYELWCAVNAVSPLSPTGFGKRLPGRVVQNYQGDTATIDKTKSGTIKYRNVQLADGIVASLRAQKQAMRRHGDKDAGDPGPQAPDDYGAQP
jgi:putative DNA primase/helicase